MKQVCQGKIYNTETAELLYSHSGRQTHFFYNGGYEDLYVTENGNYFVAYKNSVEMGAQAVNTGIKDAIEASGICPLTEDETVQWLADRNADAVIQEHFSEIMDNILEEA